MGQMHTGLDKRSNRVRETPAELDTGVGVSEVLNTFLVLEVGHDLSAGVGVGNVVGDTTGFVDGFAGAAVRVMVDHVLVENVANWVEVDEDDASSRLQDLVNSPSPSLKTYKKDEHKGWSVSNAQVCVTTEVLLVNSAKRLATSRSTNQLTVP